MEREREVYRQSVLDRYASLDETTELPGLVPSWERLAVAAVGMLLGAALLWGALGSVPVEVVGQGFLEAAEDREANGGASAPAGPGGVAVLSVPAAAVDGIRPGMPVRIAPAGVRGGAHGIVAGQVMDARPAAAAAVPGHVRVQVRSGARAAGQPAGWGSPAGRRIPVSGAITVRRERPLALLLHRLRARGVSPR
ncbi:MAG: hypothetical protein ABW277_24765 [Longimicrobiaceae bacterium]